MKPSEPTPSAASSTASPSQAVPRACPPATLRLRVHDWCTRHLPPHLYDRQHQSWRTRFKRSLYLRLLTMFLLLALGTTLVFVAGTREAFSNGWRSVVQPLFTDYVDRLATEVGSPPSIERARAITERLPISIHIEGPRVNWDSHPTGDVPAPDASNALGTPGTPNTSANTNADSTAGQPEDARNGLPPRWWKSPQQWRNGIPHDAKARAMLTRQSADGHLVRFGLGDLSWDEQPHRYAWTTLTALLLLTALAFAYVRHLLKPLDDIRAGAMRFGQGEFSQPIPLRHRDELGDLAHQVNQMVGNLGRMLESQRGLLLAISHELRSPLTRARLNAEMVAEGPERDALLRDLAQMRDLISDLLESERLAGGPAALQTAPTDLNALVRSLITAQFANHPVTLKLAADLMPVQIDPSRVQLLLRNLLDNALRHSCDATQPPEVRTEARPDGGWRLVVRDHGRGISAEQRARLGEPFYRPDTARTRRSGGVGLGLYLCKLVAQSHGGQLLLDDAAPGLSVTLDMPGTSTSTLKA